MEHIENIKVLILVQFSRQCETVLKRLETIDDDAEKFSVDFVKVIDKRLAKQYQISEFPTLTMFRDGELTKFEGDLTEPEQVLEFLTSEDTLTLPGIRFDREYVIVVAKRNSLKIF